MSRRPWWPIGWSSALALFLMSAHAAGGSPADESAAEAAFRAGRALMREGRYEEACKKLEASFALDPAVGTLLNIADCLERTGRTASAWLRYRDAAGMALQKGQREREAIAREKVAELEPVLCRLVIRAPRAGAAVRRDGVPLDPTTFDLPVPMDPGRHVVELSERGRVIARRDVDLVATPAKPCGEMVVSFDDGDATTPSTARDSRGLLPPKRATGTTRVLGMALGGVGIAALGLGTGFGLAAASAKSDADDLCTAAGCTAAGRARMAEAGERADVASVGLVTGGVLLAAGVFLWFLGAPPQASAPSRAAAPLGIAF